jgi:GT2 family glycosyltransferase
VTFKQPVLTIGIPTCARPQSISTCLNSIKEHVKIPHRLLIVDSTGTDININLYKEFDNMTYITFDHPVPPGASRKIIAENTSTEYLLFLDDDLVVKDNSIEIMLEHLENNSEVSIVSGAWREYGVYRKIGQQFNFGTTNGKPIVWKSFISVNEVKQLRLSAIRVDGAPASLLLKTAVFNKVTFDERYGFYYELFDFFMQCLQERIYIEVLPEVEFEHRPTKYRTRTTKQSSDRERDRNRFIEKWEITPVGALGGNIEKKSFVKYFISKILAKIGHAI